jgi:Fe-S-cluster-containing dehydrogenase component
MDYNRVIYVEQGSYPDTKRYFVPMPCMHCGKPPCLAACPVGAISKHEVNGIVEYDTDKCIGCKYCVWACPFGAPQFNADKRVTQKCTLCSHKTVDADSVGDQNWLANGRRKTRALTAVGGTPTVLYTDPKTA